MSDETTWDTDEVERWIANVEWLYSYCRDLARRAIDEHRLATLLRDTVDWDSLDGLEVEMWEVDWEHIARELIEEHR